MRDIFFVLVPISLLAVLTALGFGIYALFRGGDFGRSYSNKLMRLRVVLQFVAIIILVLAALVWRRHYLIMVTLNRIYTRTGDAG